MTEYYHTITVGANKPIHCKAEEANEIINRMIGNRPNSNIIVKSHTEHSHVIFVYDAKTKMGNQKALI